MLGNYVTTKSGDRGFVLAIDDGIILDSGKTYTDADISETLWSRKHLDDRYVPILPMDDRGRLNQIFETWEPCDNVSDLTKPTCTEKHKDRWTIGACLKDGQLTQLQITHSIGTWVKNVTPIKATRKDCFALGEAAIDYAEAVLAHLPDLSELTRESSQVAEEISPEKIPTYLKHLVFDALEREAGTQQRQALNLQMLEDYTARYKQREEAPPCEVYQDPESSKYILKHGFHRDAARRRAVAEVRQAIAINEDLAKCTDEAEQNGYRKDLYDLDLIDHSIDELRSLEEWLNQGLWCEIRIDTADNAIWESCRDNADNGASRTRADMHRAIDTALRHPRSLNLSDRDIAAHVKTSPRTVRKRRQQLEAAGQVKPKESVEYSKGGKTHTMKIQGFKRPDAGAKSEGLTFSDVAAMYAPYGEFKHYWGDRLIKFEFSCPDKTVHFKTLKEASDKFAKVTDGLIKIADRPLPPVEDLSSIPAAPEFQIGDQVRGFLYNDGRKEVKGYVASISGKTLVLNNGLRIFMTGAEIIKRYEATDKRGQEKTAIAKSITPMDFKNNNYSLVILDPPWEYGLRETDETHRGRTPYPTMTDAEIINLPIGEIAANDSYCLLWATTNHLPLAMQCLEAWGFSYKTTHVWVKTTKDGENVKIGVGHYGRNCTEFYLIGTKGKPPSFTALGLTDIPSVIHEAPGAHSAKPDQFYARSHRLANALGGETIELFARNPQPGWDLWGNQAPEQTEPTLQEVTAP